MRRRPPNTGQLKKKSDVRYLTNTFVRGRLGSQNMAGESNGFNSIKLLLRYPE